ncbi:hypothetical protein ACRAWG_34345 [Methylobacterium sp. P31]
MFITQRVSCAERTESVRLRTRDANRRAAAMLEYRLRKSRLLRYVLRNPSQRTRRIRRNNDMAAHSPQWHEGMTAKKVGQSIDMHPYEVGSQQSADWLAGFTSDEPDQNVDQAWPGNS